MTYVPEIDMFQFMRNGRTPGTEGLFQSFTKALFDVGGRLGSVQREGAGGFADYIAMVEFGDAAITLNVEVKLMPPRTRADVTRLAKRRSTAVNALVAPFLSPSVRDELRKSGWSYWDATGNMLIRSVEPPVWIDRIGASRDPDPDTSGDQQSLRSLKGKAASEVVVSLLSDGGATSVREAARKTGTGVGTASRVIDLLRTDGVLEVSTAGIRVPDRIALATRWAQDYGFVSTFKPGRYLSLLGEDLAIERLRRSDIRYALTGSRAAAAEFTRNGRVAPLPPVGIWLYTDDIASVERTMDLAPDRRGGILVAGCDFLSDGREGSQDADPAIARHWRIVGDLLAAGGRLTAMGEDLAMLTDAEATE